ncbi:DNA-directed RNA polymerase subunit alpha [Candidatus Phytoplasma pruni]|uniref:DNA-directed RNA polymerase subunit alpha n=1 Tax=Candidatus Phytoplasma pruni TaxID=479893 RepID=A0A0M1N0I4_9MOLU|nr:MULTISPECIES: DNA-directed RNA polymerase subunit alpha [16SrIII (X-disease group)]KOR75464.1 DNA-directed RNA polymerase subunit alpha [Candidatus Phytoplasma pruni]MCQ9618681.1 DNA-directed RNA polymerase subunit alpha [Candidatus Phytoplasma pruni]WEK82398.1 MAG: DNA-directed RNA polymerase subunit alpha [Candidatus Phytoplasma pruni]
MKKLKFLRPIMLVDNENDDVFDKRFVIQRLEKGYGTTIGNSLRRVLLSSLPGAAIVNVCIDGAEHEFTVMDGVYEDIMTIILNLKKVVIAVDSQDEDFEQKLEIDITGEKTVTAADFNVVDGVDIINKDQVIAHVSENTRFRMQATVRRGIGYESAANNKVFNKNQFGVIAIDSLYTPVVKTTYTVEQKLSNKEELVVDIETNKAITAKQALSTASKILADHFNVLVNLCEQEQQNDFIYEAEIENYNHALDLKIEQLDLSARLLNSLNRSGINTVKELVSQKEKDISKLNSLGKKSFDELKAKMNELELRFDMPINNK